MFIATLVALDGLGAGDISAACDAVQGRAGAIVDGVACDVRFDGDAKAARSRLESMFDHFDVIVQVEAHRRRKLLVADMDSTMITVECIDELADYAGIKPEVAAITERAMRGEIDFAGALRERVALLGGLPEKMIAKCLRDRVTITGGAKALVQTMRANGGYTVLVSGGFTAFAEPVATEIGFDRVIANRLIVRDGVLTGEVEWPIVDAATKRQILLDTLAERGWASEDSLAIGDGANDIPMIEAAGLGIAYHAKSKTETAADARVTAGDLAVVGYALGFEREARIVR